MHPVKLEEHHDTEVWTNVMLDSLRREECLCLNCQNLEDCSAAYHLYNECRKWNMALAVTRCPEWRAKSDA